MFLAGFYANYAKYYKLFLLSLLPSFGNKKDYFGVVTFETELVFIKFGDAI
jgi:hypothetical protein